MNMMNSGNGFFFLPLAMLRNLEGEEGGKIGHDRENVYVNGDYVGDRISLNQNDDGLKAIEDYLKSRNFQGYRVTQEGDRIYIDVEDEKEGEAIKNHLGIYTKIR